MAKAKVAPKPPAGQAIPLEDISISWNVEGYGAEPVTISGRGLARVLCYLGKVRPGALDTFGDPEDVSNFLDAIAKLQMDHNDPQALDYGEVLWSLGLLTEDLSARLYAGIHGSKLAKVAMVTVGGQPKAAVA